MKKMITAILMFDLALGLLFLCLLVSKNISAYNTTGDSYLVDNLGGNFFVTGDSEGETSLESDATVAETLTEKRIALTFDDGPHPRYTEMLLDGLKERGVVATFFVTGEHAALHPDIIEFRSIQRRVNTHLRSDRGNHRGGSALCPPTLWFLE